MLDGVKDSFSSRYRVRLEAASEHGVDMLGRACHYGAERYQDQAQKPFGLGELSRA